MVPGEHHLRLNMDIAQAQNGTFRPGWSGEVTARARQPAR
jgi:hypothetical protein